MNKFKKLAVASVAVIMAGTMTASFAACGGGSGSSGGGGNGETPRVELDYNVLNEDGSINYSTYTSRSKVTLNLAVGNGNEEPQSSTFFRGVGAEITLPDGTLCTDGKVKPAWAQMGTDLNINWVDKWSAWSTSANLNNLTAPGGGYSDVDIFTTDLDVAVSKAKSGTSILNLAKYLDYMPNFKSFLNDNAVVYLSLLQDGMNTSTGAGQTIYIAPYFDGYDDIERYCIIRHDWAKILLNGNDSTDSTKTFRSECATSATAKSFMGTTGSYTVDALTKDGSDVQKIKKDYDKALKAVKEDTPLADAYKAITGNKPYGGDSGNIIDIMNAALAENIDATGAELVDLYRAYVDACYVDASGNTYYNADERANLFVGYDACWDVDDLVAILRCAKTNASALLTDPDFANDKIGGIAPRSNQNDRTPVMVSLACQLYGVRGGTSRNEYTYIDNNGNLQDARTNKAFFEAMANFNLLKQEGLIASYGGSGGAQMGQFTTDSGMGTGTSAGTEYFMTYDYSQTQTVAGFVAESDYTIQTNTFQSMPEDYYFAPVITPVSKWNVDGDETISENEYFRFTESWRSTKTSGLAVNGAVEKNKDKLTAALQFIDYLYSEDGQIVSTFGPMAKNANGEGGFWYDTKATAQEIEDGDFFTYKGEKYSGTDYKGKRTPTLTTAMLESFKGTSNIGEAFKTYSFTSDAILNYTNYARYLIGSTLPLGVKNQSFENQLTSEMGKYGVKLVATAIDKKVVKGLSLKIDENNWWYTCVPTSLPLTSTQSTTLTGSSQKPFTWLTGEANQSGAKNFYSIMNRIILDGPSGTYNENGVQRFTYTSIDDMFTKTLGSATFDNLARTRRVTLNQAWQTAKGYWEYLKTVTKN